jgi:putative transposase
VKRLRAYKTELKVNDHERTLLTRYAGAARYVFNWALADRIATFEAGGKPNKFEQKRRFNALKHELCPWLGEIAYVVTESAFDNLDQAYQNFFRRVKSGAETAGFPRFKSRKRGIGGFTLRGSIHVFGDTIQLPRIGRLRLAERNYLPTGDVKILSVNISEHAGHWLISLQVEEEVAEPVAATGPAIGVDLGVKSLAVCSDGATFDNPRTLRKYERKLARLQRELSRRQKGSHNREKTKQKIARLHYKIANTRRHTLHEISSHVTVKSKPCAVVIEDLNIKGMVKNRSLSKAISDASFAELRRQIEYKSSWHGVRVVIADRWYPSSKTCSACGNVKPVLSLSERTYVCEVCGVVIDRDQNAALNLAALAR